MLTTFFPKSKRFRFFFFDFIVSSGEGAISSIKNLRTFSVFDFFLAVDVKYKLRFDKEKWHYTMFYMDRTMASDLKEKIKENVIAFYSFCFVKYLRNYQFLIQEQHHAVYGHFLRVNRKVFTHQGWRSVLSLYLLSFNHF